MSCAAGLAAGGRAQSACICAMSASLGVELAVAADEIDELDLDLAAVEIAVEVEQEDLEHRHAVVVGRPRAEIGGTVVALAPPRRRARHRCRGRARCRAAAATLAVGKPRPRAALGAADDRAADAPPAAQHAAAPFTSPCASRSRMALEENTSPSSATGAMMVMPKPSRCAPAPAWSPACRCGPCRRRNRGR